MDDEDELPAALPIRPGAANETWILLAEPTRAVLGEIGGQTIVGSRVTGQRRSGRTMNIGGRVFGSLTDDDEVRLAQGARG